MSYVEVMGKDLGLDPQYPLDIMSTWVEHKSPWLSITEHMDAKHAFFEGLYSTKVGAAKSTLWNPRCHSQLFRTKFASSWTYQLC